MLAVPPSLQIDKLYLPLPYDDNGITGPFSKGHSEVVFDYSLVRHFQLCASLCDRLNNVLFSSTLSNIIIYFYGFIITQRKKICQDNRPEAFFRKIQETYSIFLNRFKQAYNSCLLGMASPGNIFPSTMADNPFCSTSSKICSTICSMVFFPLNKYLSA